jgi:hypothetical protein
VKKIPLLLALGIFLILACIVFLYDFKLDNERTPWEFIGKNTVLVYKPPVTPNSTGQQLFRDVTKNFSDASIQIALDQLLASKNVLTAVTVTAKDNFDVVFYAPLSADSEKKRWEEFLRVIRSKKIEPRKRNFEGVVIYDIGSPSKNSFTYTVMDNVFIGSSTSFLVEDAVRIALAEDPITFRQENAKLFQLSTLEQDGGDIYINLPEFFRWIRSFSDTDLLGLTIPFGNSLVTDLKIDQENAIFNGFATDSTETGNSFLALFANQAPVAFGMKSVISTNSAAVLRYGIPQPEKWYTQREAFLKKQKPAIQDSLNQLSLYKFNPVEFYGSIGDEVGLSLRTNGTGITSVFIAKLKNVRSGMSALENLSDAVSVVNKDSLYSERYSDYTIRKIALSNFTYTLFWPLASTSSETYFTLVGDYVMFSESEELLKQSLNDIDEENTWSKSLRWNTFLQTALQESTVDIFFDVNLLSSYVKDHLTTRWKPYFEATQFLSVERGVIQFSRLEQDYYFTGNFPLRKDGVASKAQKSVSSTTLPHLLTSRPFLVKNHDTGNMELIVQDTLNSIYLIGSRGKIEWQLPLDSKISDEISQVDFYKNGKLQYLFITQNKIHIIDRLGRYITGFPKTLDSNHLKFSSVVDYDKSKNYRFLVSDNDRKIYITDKEGSLLEGWNPKRFSRNLFAPPRHYRIQGKDYFVAIQDDGIVYIMNRRGELSDGFPLALHARPEGDYFFQSGKNLSASTFTIVSREGSKIQFNLLGKITDQEALIKRDTKSRFYLLISDDKKSCAVVRIDAAKIAAFNPRGTLLFEKENPGSESLVPGLFSLGSDSRVFSLTDVEQKLCYLWNEQGNPILPNPIETGHTPALRYNAQNEEMKIYWTGANAIMSTSVRWSH